jgi:hypothetical protein
MPADVEQRVRELMSELGTLTCERSSNCCGMYGFAPLTDCTQLSYGTLLTPISGSVGIGNDPSMFDFVFDEKMSKACLDAASALADQCGSTNDRILDACEDVVHVTKKGAPPSDCRSDGTCAIIRGTGYRCIESRCLPEVEVAIGAGCFPGENPTSVPTCGANGACDFSSGKCVLRAAAGQGCNSDFESCVDGLGCVDGVCSPKLAEGKPCNTTSACLEGLECRRNDETSFAMICLSDPGVGGACHFPGQCTGAASCTDGICRPWWLSICQPPSQH